MTIAITRAISLVFSPLIVPTLGMLVLLFSHSYNSLLPMQLKMIILMVVAVNSFVLPLLMISLFKRLGIVTSINMDNPKERLFPLFFTLIPFAFTYYFVRQLPMVTLIPQFILGGTAIVFVSFLITFWWKISIHMISVGGLVGLFYTLSIRMVDQTLPLLLIAITISGFVGWARLTLGAHRPSQVYAGFFLGKLIVCSTLYIL